MDDLDWTYAQDPHREACDSVVHRELSEHERTQPHLRAVFELIVAQHPSFTELKVQDEVVGLGAQGAGRAAPLHLRDQPPARCARHGHAAQGNAACATPAAVDLPSSWARGTWRVLR